MKIIPRNVVYHASFKKERAENSTITNFQKDIKGTDSRECLFGLPSVVVVVGQIVSNSLSILHNSAEDLLQVVELAEQIYHNSTLFLTA